LEARGTGFLEGDQAAGELEQGVWSFFDQRMRIARLRLSHE
jgi:hypothetical protein